MKRIIIGVDTQFLYHTFKRDGVQKSFPYRGFRDFIEGDEDEVLEMYATVVQLQPHSQNPEDIVRTINDYRRFKTALESEGVSTIEAPSKPSGDSAKHSDDQKLMIRLALTCTRLKPDFLVLVAADGDYAPLVWGLREEGIRTKLITKSANAANELKAAVYSLSELYPVLQQVDELKHKRRY